MQYLSINTNRITLYSKASERYNSGKLFNSQIMPRLKTETNGLISKAAGKRIRNTVNWLVALSSKRDVQIGKSVFIPKFQVSFITLTLPAVQNHSHAEIKTRCLNLFLTTLRQKYKVQNYIWKAELQENGNIHFHLTTDKAIHYMQLRKHWNKALNQLGYIDRYQIQMQNLTLTEYAAKYGKTFQNNQKRIANSYAYGVKTNWTSPNTTDVHKVNSIDNFAAYMAKYLTKPLQAKNPSPQFEASLKALKGRLWFCSTSLSRLASVQVVYNPFKDFLFRSFKALKNVTVFANEFTESIFFNLSELPKQLKEELRQYLLSYAIDKNYPFPSMLPSWA